MGVLWWRRYMHGADRARPRTLGARPPPLIPPTLPLPTALTRLPAAGELRRWALGSCRWRSLGRARRADQWAALGRVLLGLAAIYSSATRPGGRLLADADVVVSGPSRYVGSAHLHRWQRSVNLRRRDYRPLDGRAPAGLPPQVRLVAARRKQGCCRAPARRALLTVRPRDRRSAGRSAPGRRVD